MKKKLLAIILASSPLYAHCNTVWEMSNEEGFPIHASVLAFGEPLSEMGAVVARNWYSKYGDTSVVRPYFMIFNRANDPKYCSRKMLPLKVNKQWLKFSISCKSNHMFFQPQTLGDANKLKYEFISSNIVEFEGYKISAMSFTKLDKQLNEMYSTVY